MTPVVAASEPGSAQTASAEWPAGLCGGGVVRGWTGWRQPPPRVYKWWGGRTVLERRARAGESPVGETLPPRATQREYHRPRASRWEAGSTTTQG